jgi:GrpB-like predicted nucleotidyltransferase (UPF0157 family)
MPSFYSFTCYSADWPAQFEREAERLRELLRDELVGVHHIGSTSVPGLAAKPVIDLLPVVREIARVDDFERVFTEAGYEAWGEYGLAGRRFFTKDRAGHRTHNIHIYGVGNPDVERHLAFCAYLRGNENARLEYEAVKRDVYARYSADIEAYSDGKNGWIKKMEPVALAWYRSCVC